MNSCQCRALCCARQRRRCPTYQRGARFQAQRLIAPGDNGFMDRTKAREFGLADRTVSPVLLKTSSFTFAEFSIEERNQILGSFAHSRIHSFVHHFSDLGVANYQISPNASATVS